MGENAEYRFHNAMVIQYFIYLWLFRTIRLQCVVVRKRNSKVMTHIVSLARYYLYAKLQLSMQIHLLRHSHLCIDAVPD